MAWTNPTTRATGDLITASIWNTDLVENIKALAGPVATTITALNTHWGGTPPTGARGFIRAGTTPFGFIALTYDGTAAKWVSDVLFSLQQKATETTTSDAWVALTDAEGGPLLIPDYKALYDAGLRAELRIAGKLVNASVGVSTFLRVNLLDFDSGDTALVAVEQTGSISVAGTTASYQVGAWGRLTAAPTQTHAMIRFEKAVGVAANTGTLDHCQCAVRFSS